MIQHTVAFRLGDDADANGFWTGVATLEAIDGVLDFKVLRQVGEKSDFTHALSMYFETQGDYDSYNVHPMHTAFVEDLWIPNVAEFMELDYIEG